MLLTDTTVGFRSPVAGTEPGTEVFSATIVVRLDPPTGLDVAPPGDGRLDCSWVVSVGTGEEVTSGVTSRAVWVGAGACVSTEAFSVVGDVVCSAEVGMGVTSSVTGDVARIIL